MASAHENDKTAPHAMDHSPIGLMGDHRHKKGEWMTSYRFMRMDTAIIGLDNGSKSTRQINANIGVSLPTGSNKKTDQILTPMGSTLTPRLPYPMQLGTGTYDFAWRE